MSERQVQYTDGSRSREVEVTDDLLDAALARANRYNHASNCPCDPDRDPYVGCACGETRREDLRRDVLALVERVQQAERRANFEAMRAVSESIERDAVRGKLDKVRDWAHHIRTTRQRGDLEYNAASEVLAILDGKTGD